MTPLNLNTTFYILLLHRTKGFFLNNNDLQNLQEAGNLGRVDWFSQITSLLQWTADHIHFIVIILMMSVLLRYDSFVLGD